MSFSDLKKQSSLGSLTQKLVKEVEKQNGGGGGGARIDNPNFGAGGNGGSGIILIAYPS